MLKNIFNTASLKLLSNVIMLGILWLTVHFLGAEGRGEIAIFNVNLALTIILNGFIGSSVIVYLTPRTNFYKLLIPSYVWAIVSSIASPFLIQELFVFLADYFGHSIDHLHLQSTSYYLLLVICSFMGSLFEYHHMVLLGKEHIKSANLLNFIRNFSLGGFLLFLFLFSGFEGDVYGFFLSLTLAYFIGLLVSIVFIVRLEDSITKLKGFWKSVQNIIRLGFIDQISTLLQFLNKRLPMYSLVMIFGDVDTGVLSVAITLTEAFLFLTQSVSTVQYSKISNSNDAKYNGLISEKMFRFSLVILTICMVSLLLLPSQLYLFLFGQEFESLKSVISILSVGIIAFGSGAIFNHYFSGIGKFEQNVYSNLLGLSVTIFVGCSYLIPTYGIIGAAITPTLSYIVILTYLILSYKIKNRVSSNVFFPKGSEIIETVRILKSLLKEKLGK